jgi:hypothetical protein
VIIELTIQGQTPLICNRFTDAAQMSATNGTRGTLRGGSKTPRQEAEERLYIGHDGKPMIPQPNLFRCLIDGGKFFKNGKSKITTQKSSLIPSCVEVDGVEIPIRHKEPWTVDTRAVRIPSTGGRILCHRPRFDDWELDFTVMLDTDEMSESFFRQIVDKSGRAIGLGDFRPDCKGPYGKFAVIRWDAQAVERKHLKQERAA